MLQRRSRPRPTDAVACYYCLARFCSAVAGSQRTAGLGAAGTALRRRRAAGLWRRRRPDTAWRLFGTGSPRLSAAEISDLPPPLTSRPPDISPKPEHLTTRAWLEAWDRRYGAYMEPATINYVSEGGVSNLAGMDANRIHPDGEDEGSRAEAWCRDALVDLGEERVYLLPGDLVSLGFSGLRQQELAIYIREIGAQSQFYTMSGRWVHKSFRSADFTVPAFVAPAELDTIIPWLPAAEVDATQQDQLNDLPAFPPRDVGKPLVQKMRRFWAQSDETFLAAAARLDNLPAYVSAPDAVQNKTLEEIAALVLPATITPDETGKLPSHALYAVQRAIQALPFGIRHRPKSITRSGAPYQIFSQSDLTAINSVTEAVRTHQSLVTNPLPDFLPTSSEIERFATKARKIIDASRRTRPFQGHSTIGPFSGMARLLGGLSSELEPREPFTQKDGFQNIIRFLQAWSVYETIEKKSELNSVGSAILRAVDRYPGIPLTSAAGWVLLQELGIYAPWEYRALFALYLASDGQPPLLPPTVIQQDAVQHIRKDWGDLPVYCIDSAGAHEIDDGISIEPTERDDQFWVHVHTADPASHIDPKGALAKRAASMVENSYMPEKVHHMLDPDFVREHLSLDKDRPCLTFSAKMDMSGNILETNVTPGIVRNVIFTSPDAVHMALSETREPEVVESVYSVGTPISSQPAWRRMTECHEFTPEMVSQLKGIQAVGAAREAYRVANGALRYRNAGFSVSVSLDGVSSTKLEDITDAGSKPISSTHYQEDPSIQLKVTTVGPDLVIRQRSLLGVKLVENLMLLAGEVAAEFCRSRSIPAPFRVSLHNPLKPEAELRRFYRDVVQPSLDANGYASHDIVQQYRDKIPGASLSTTSGPLLSMGVPAMIKCTSPLRRYADLLLHWQIEAALLWEAAHKTAFDTQTTDPVGILPFSAAELKPVLEHIYSTESTIRAASRAANRSWTAQLLLRAWKHGDACPSLSKTLHLVLADPPLLPSGKASGMLLDLLLEHVECVLPPDMPAASLRPRDVLVVTLCDVDVYRPKVTVAAVARLDRAA